MKSRDLEFRGINREHLGMYFEELGAKQLTNTFPYLYEAEGWSGQILSEEKIAFTAVFIVNAVHVRFSAENDNLLKELLKNYRYKTTRIGG
ncbi:MAG: hypothetical protein K6T88_16815 [Bacillus sp. (in: Bacteria)]|nr:hypothetical protein [Bacillus sp. (in: firmicutes)]